MPFTTTPGETRTTRLAFALLLRDRFAGTDELLGTIAVTSDSEPGKWNRSPQGSFVFFHLPPGAHVLKVSSDRWTPYYQPVSIPVTVPAVSSNWPAFPDIALADLTLPLGDPAQPAAFRSQYQQASLVPTAQYPFDAGATLLRGTVTQGGNRLADATVTTLSGTELPYVTSISGEYVLFFENATGVPSNVTVKVTHAALPDKQQNVIITRGATTTNDVAF